jgi:hypothetical protein
MALRGVSGGNFPHTAEGNPIVLPHTGETKIEKAIAYRNIFRKEFVSQGGDSRAAAGSETTHILCASRNEVNHETEENDARY